MKKNLDRFFPPKKNENIIENDIHLTNETVEEKENFIEMKKKIIEDYEDKPVKMNQKDIYDFKDFKSFIQKVSLTNFGNEKVK